MPEAQTPTPPSSPKPPYVPKYIVLSCHDTVWVMAIINILRKKFGWGQEVHQSDAYMDNRSGDVLFYINRDTIPMDQVAALLGTTPERLTTLKNITLKPLPFAEGTPKPTVTQWGNA